MKEELLQKFKEVRDLIAGGWTQNTYARKEDGSTCDVLDPAAKKFCLAGAIRKVFGLSNDQSLKDDQNQLLKEMLTAFRQHLGDWRFNVIVDYNDVDCNDVRGVLHLLDKIIGGMQLVQT